MIKYLQTIVVIVALSFPLALFAEVFEVNSQQEFNSALNNVKSLDSIVWKNGWYSDILMDIDVDGIFIVAETLGQVVFTGSSRVELRGSYVTFEGFQFLDGDIGTKDVINIRGSNNLITQINIRAYTSYKYLRVREESEFVVISYCNFENRLNLDDQNILSILVDENEPGYHKIQYCSFKNFEGTGNDLGIEPIRIGLSTQADHISRCLVEHCYFTQCDGDGELISSKASQNVYRYNTFENNSKAELVLRHGSEAIVYGNFFLNGKGGVRVREGQNHYIYNNYFYELDDRAIFLQNESSDPLDNINIAFNTIVDCSEVILGNDGSNKPTNVTFANNIFADPDDGLFEESTGNETWISNIAFGNLGIISPSSGLSSVDPLMELNSAGFWGLTPNSPAIDQVEAGFLLLPIFEGVESIDSEILFDLMGQERPTNITSRDLGCNEYPHSVEIGPLATEENTGPNYNTSVNPSAQSTVDISFDIHLFPNPAKEQVTLKIAESQRGGIAEIYDTNGKMVRSVEITAGKESVNIDISAIACGTYLLIVKGENGNEIVDTAKFVKVQ